MCHGVTGGGGFLEEAKFFVDFSVHRGTEECSGFRRKINVKGGGQECPLHQGRGGRTRDSRSPSTLLKAGSATAFPRIAKPAQIPNSSRAVVRRAPLSVPAPMER